VECMNKDELRKKLLEIRQYYLDERKEKLELIRPIVEERQSNVPPILELNPSIEFCESTKQHELWWYFRNMISSAPYSGDVGRRIRWLVVDKNTNFVLGFAGLSSSLSIPIIDKHIGWTREQKWKNKMVNNTMNMSHCIATPEFSKYLTGKITALSCISKEVIDKFEKKYGDEAVMFMTTSLFGKSSIYNRLKGFLYLGNTKGYSATLIDPKIKRQMREDYKREKGKHSEIYYNEDGSVKWEFGVVKSFQKLNKYAQIQRVENLRGVYILPLAENYQYFLCQRDENLVQLPRETFEDLVQYWRERWFNNRVDRIEAHGN
jgi:hypothetical protein